MYKISFYFFTLIELLSLTQLIARLENNKADAAILVVAKKTQGNTI